jgi:hypothetical protein
VKHAALHPTCKAGAASWRAKSAAKSSEASSGSFVMMVSVYQSIWT